MKFIWLGVLIKFIRWDLFLEFGRMRFIGVVLMESFCFFFRMWMFVYCSCLFWFFFIFCFSLFVMLCVLRMSIFVKVVLLWCRCLVSVMFWICLGKFMRLVMNLWLKKIGGKLVFLMLNFFCLIGVMIGWVSGCVFFFLIFVLILVL